MRRGDFAFGKSKVNIRKIGIVKLKEGDETEQRFALVYQALQQSRLLTQKHTPGLLAESTQSPPDLFCNDSALS